MRVRQRLERGRPCLPARSVPRVPGWTRQLVCSLVGGRHLVLQALQLRHEVRHADGLARLVPERLDDLYSGQTTHQSTAGRPARLSMRAGGAVQLAPSPARLAAAQVVCTASRRDGDTHCLAQAQYPPRRALLLAASISDSVTAPLLLLMYCRMSSQLRQLRFWSHWTLARVRATSDGEPPRRRSFSTASSFSSLVRLWGSDSRRCRGHCDRSGSVTVSGPPLLLGAAAVTRHLPERRRRTHTHPATGVGWVSMLPAEAAAHCHVSRVQHLGNLRDPVMTRLLVGMLRRARRLLAEANARGGGEGGAQVGGGVAAGGPSVASASDAAHALLRAVQAVQRQHAALALFTASR